MLIDLKLFNELFIAKLYKHRTPLHFCNSHDIYGENKYIFNGYFRGEFIVSVVYFQTTWIYSYVLPGLDSSGKLNNKIEVVLANAKMVQRVESWILGVRNTNDDFDGYVYRKNLNKYIMSPCRDHTNCFYLASSIRTTPKNLDSRTHGHTRHFHDH